MDSHRNQQSGPAPVSPLDRPDLYPGFKRK
jgi:hypothetical protein